MCTKCGTLLLKKVISVQLTIKVSSEELVSVNETANGSDHHWPLDKSLAYDLSPNLVRKGQLVKSGETSYTDIFDVERI